MVNRLDMGCSIGVMFGYLGTLGGVLTIHGYKGGKDSILTGHGHRALGSIKTGYGQER